MSKARCNRYAYLDRLNLSRLLRLAASDEVEKELATAALYCAINELLEIEIEHRLTTDHDNAGYASSSPLAYAGEGGGSGPRGQSDGVLLAAMNHRGQSAWRELSRALLGTLKENSQRAVLISAYAVKPTRAAQRSPRMMSQTEACEPERLANINQALGWPPLSGPRYKAPDALRTAARRARHKMAAALSAMLADAVGAEHDPARLSTMPKRLEK